MLVEWAMPSVWRSTMPTISLTSRTVSLIVPKPDWAARLRSTPVLISVVTAPASRVSSPIVEAIWLVAARVSCASFFTSAATTAKLRPASPARAASMVALSASMLVLRAIVSMVEETVCTWFIAEAKPAMRSPSWTTSSVRPLKPSIVPSIASRPASSLALACSDKQPRFVGGIGDARLVAQQPGGHFLELVEHLQMLADALADALHVAGDVAAFHRQRPAIARDRADRIFRDFLNPLRGHRQPRSRTIRERDTENLLLLR